MHLVAWTALHRAVTGGAGIGRELLLEIDSHLCDLRVRPMFVAAVGAFLRARALPQRNVEATVHVQHQPVDFPVHYRPCVAPRALDYHAARRSRLKQPRRPIRNGQLCPPSMAMVLRSPAPHSDRGTVRRGLSVPGGAMDGACHPGVRQIELGSVYDKSRARFLGLSLAKDSGTNGAVSTLHPGLQGSGVLASNATEAD